MMFRFSALAVVLFLFVQPAVAQDIQPRDRQIEAVIADQLDAFKADDLVRAFDFASPSIKRLFGTPENFGVMVRRGYPMVWRPGAVTFLDLSVIDGRIWQRVEIIDAAGERHHLGYEMIAGEDGWRIGGVRILQLPDMAV